MTLWDQLYIWLDLILIAPYRLFDHPVAGFFFGTFVLCLWCVLIGELSYRLAARVKRSHIQKYRNSMVKMHNLSIKALLMKDKRNWRACNTEAHEAFGKYFFNMITLGAAFLWPVPFALGWMHNRFGEVQLDLLFPLPLLGESAGLAAVLLPMYILCRIFWAKLKRAILPQTSSSQEEEEEMISMKEVDEHGGIPEKYWRK